MDALATLFKLNTSEKEGYLSISDLENTSEYIFKNTIKTKANKDKSNTHFTKWIAYWEGVNFAVEMTVLLKVLSISGTSVKENAFTRRYHNSRLEKITVLHSLVGG